MKNEMRRKQNADEERDSQQQQIESFLFPVLLVTCSFLG